MRTPLNLEGERFGRLVAREPTAIVGGKTRRAWLCLCDCGGLKTVNQDSLRQGLTTSCGCLARESSARVGRSTRKHGLWSHRLYNIYMKIRERCENPSCKSYPNYGGRGIQCLFADAPTFIAWAEASGYIKGKSIDRIDNDGPYAPGNCRWATAKEQTRNRRDNVIVIHQSERRCLAEWAEIRGLNYRTVRSRMRKGMSAEQALGLEPRA